MGKHDDRRAGRALEEQTIEQLARHHEAGESLHGEGD